MARVLVVDDDAEVLDVVSAFLRSAGHEVLVARNGAQAKAVFAERPAEVVVTDLNMPELDGFGLKTYLSTLPEVVPVIIVSGTWTPEERKKATSFGFARLYDKPVNLQQLLADIAALAPKRK